MTRLRDPPNQANPLVRRQSGGYEATRSLIANDDILTAADDILERRFRRQERIRLDETAKRFLRTKLLCEDRQQFGCLFLDGNRYLLAWELLFQGTNTHCPIYPRVVVKRALDYHCSGVILAHFHPSGDLLHVPRDRDVTRRISRALALVDIEVVDHIVLNPWWAESLADSVRLREGRLA